MELTIKTLKTIREQLIKEYETSLDEHNIITSNPEVNGGDIVESLRELSYIDGQVKILEFLEYIIEDDPDALKIINNYLKEN